VPDHLGSVGELEAVQDVTPLLDQVSVGVTGEILLSTEEFKITVGVDCPYAPKMISMILNKANRRFIISPHQN
jgi:hypothetical protein